MSHNVRDRRKGWWWVDHCLFDHIDRPIEGFVYCVLAHHANEGNDEPDLRGCAWPALKTIAKKAHCSVPSAVKALKSLEAKGLIEIERRQDKRGQITNLYTLLESSHWEKREQPPINEVKPPPSPALVTPPCKFKSPSKRALYKQEEVEQTDKEQAETPRAGRARTHIKYTKPPTDTDPSLNWFSRVCESSLGESFVFSPRHAAAARRVVTAIGVKKATLGAQSLFNSPDPFVRRNRNPSHLEDHLNDFLYQAGGPQVGKVDYDRGACAV